MPNNEVAKEENPQMIKDSILNAVANEGLGVCYDAYALSALLERNY